MKYYICGPMRGYPVYNFHAFFDAERSLKADGFECVNPARRDMEGGFNPFCDVVNESQYEAYIVRDLKDIEGCDRLYMLKGWAGSVGARRERDYAIVWGKKIDYDVAAEPAGEKPCDKPGDAIEDILVEAQRLTSRDRRRMYSPPKDDFGRQAALWSAILGITVEARQVGLCLLAMKIARATQSKKRDTWVDIAGYARCCWEVDGCP